MFKDSFFIGDLELPSNIIHSPLAGCSDLAYREMLRRYHNGLIFCEMVKIDALVRNDKTTFSLLKYTSQMHPIGAQLCGSKPELAAPSARIIEDLGFDVVDLNCGCPVDKVTKDGSGSGLLRLPEKIGEIVSNIKAAVNIPVTVKIRVGWDDDSIIGDQIVRIAESAGADAIAVHGRTRSQGYKGPAQRDHIRAAVEAAKHIPVIANGDIFDPLSAQDMFEKTGADALLIARGGMGAPWLAKQLVDFFQTGTFQTPDSFKALKDHIDLVFQFENTKKALLDIRRVSSWYLKSGEKMRAMRGKMSRLKSKQELEELLELIADEHRSAPRVTD